MSETPPGWFSSAMQAMQAHYPDDLFVMVKGSTEWRIRCLDCPAKSESSFIILDTGY
ncbi:hypothetical protein D9619_009651 [Psilocybe cf. subviscida]|uniref:Uncharacterized protein n=1 Tax=Psilocybe cf. subviscida TaxID=2480587 RepID=A0A8H5BL14_9AGAR|nr:hypothetical protein D9619_009651 [Psilocybe cf. subviscida]